MKKAAFSLLEIIVAIALFSLVVLGLLKLFPVARQMGSETQQTTHATFIAESILEILKATAPQGIIATGPEWKMNSSDVVSFSLDAPSLRFVAYDNKDQPLRALTLQEYDSALHEEGAASIARIETIMTDQSSGVVRIAVTIASPAARPDKQRHHTEFSMLLSTKGSVP